MKSKKVIYIGLAADCIIAVTKFIGASVSGSSAMVSEGIHSVIDCVTQVMLLWGIRASQRKPDDKRPFGYGREVYFWSFIVSLVIFTLGGCISFYDGMRSIEKPFAQRDGFWDYTVLVVAFVFNAISGGASLRAFNKQRGEIPFWKAVRDSKDPAIFIVLLSDVGDLLGLVVAFLGVYLGRLLHNNYYDGAASLIIGVILIVISALLLRESRSLLMGETPAKKTLLNIIALAEADEAILKIKQHFSIYLAPEEVMVQLLAIFKENLTTEQITDAIGRVTAAIKQKFPRIKQIFIEPVVEG